MRDRSSRFSWRSAALGALLHAYGAGLAWLGVFALSFVGIDFPSLGWGGVVGAAAGGWLELLFALTLAGGLLLAAIIAGIWAARGAGGERDWERAAVTAAATLQSLQLMQLIYGFSACILLSVAAAAAALLALARIRLRTPLLVAGTPAALALLVLGGIHGAKFASFMAENERYDRSWQVEKAALARDDAALRAALHRARKAELTPLALKLARGGENLMNGDYLAQITMLVQQSDDPCLDSLRVVLLGDAVPADLPATPDCGLLAAYLSARMGRPRTLEWAVGRLAGERARLGVLGALLAGPDEEAALRFARAAGYLDSRGLLDPRYYSDAFVIAVWAPSIRPEQQPFFWKHADLDPLLVATFGFDGYTPVSVRRLRGLLEHGARINGISPSGATPLTAFLTARNLDPKVLEFLLKLGADPNLPGTAYSRDDPTHPAGPAKPPLWHLIAHSEKTDQNSNEGRLFQLLLTAGADRSVVREYPRLSERTRGFLNPR